MPLSKRAIKWLGWRPKLKSPKFCSDSGTPEIS